MSASNDQIIEKVREYRKRSGKTQADLADLLGKTTASISDLERGRVQLSASELSQIADFLNVPINSFFTETIEDEEIQNVIYAIQEQPKDARINSFGMVKLYLEIQALYKKISSRPKKEYQPEELGEIVTKILTFQSQYKSMTSKLDSTIDGLIQVLKEHGITLPKQ
jgi:transcriptional regulator with XRE-family HTH domain